MGALLGAGILVYGILGILFLAGIPILIASIILLIIGITRKIKKTKKYKLQFILSIIGIIVSGIFMYPIFGYMSLIKGFFTHPVEEENIDTGTIIYWETSDKGVLYGKIFNYNGRVYRECTDFGITFRAGADEAVANIHHKRQYSIGKYLGIYREETIYTVKNCNDLSLLASEKNPSTHSLYCDVDFHAEKKEYYENRDNYDYFISKTKKHFVIRTGNEEIVSRPLSEADFSFLEKIKYGYSDDYIKIPRKGTYEHINIFGKSLDGIGQRLFNDFLVDGNIIYSIVSNHGEEYFVVELNDEYKNIIASLLE